MVKARFLSRLVGLAALPLMLISASHADVKFSGYTQIRLNNWDDNMAKPSDDQFQIRRARIKADAGVADDTTFTLQVDFSNAVNDEKGSSNIEVKDAVIRRKLSPEWSASFGYTQTPFGYEVPSSDSANWFFEKSQVMNKLFPGERDTGLYFHYVPARPNTPMVDFGYGNGMHNWYNGADLDPATGKNTTRDTDSHAFVARVQMPLERGGSAGVSYFAAKRAGTLKGEEFDDSFNTWGAHVNYLFPHNWNLRAEYFDGHLPTLSGSDVVDQTAKGWYGFASYTLTDKPVTIFGRYDTYDAGSANNFNRYCVGVGMDRTKSDRYTLQIERITNDGSGKSDTNIGVQWQVKY